MNYRKSKFGIAFWIIFVLLLGFALLVISGKSGALLNKITDSIKEAFFPYG